MKRRDFLMFRTDRRGRVVELSCRRLYLRHLEGQSTMADAPGPPAGESWSEGEPPAAFSSETVAEALQALERALTPGDTLRVLDRPWIEHVELSRLVDDLARTHRARGGLVES